METAATAVAPRRPPDEDDATGAADNLGKHPMTAATGAAFKMADSREAKDIRSSTLEIVCSFQKVFQKHPTAQMAEPIRLLPPGGKIAGESKLAVPKQFPAK